MHPAPAGYRCEPLGEKQIHFRIEACGDTIGAMGPVWVPLAQRASHELQAKAEELRQMAITASTHQVALSLLNLAARYQALAERRRDQGD